MKKKKSGQQLYSQLQIIREINELLNEARDLDSILKNVVLKISESLGFEVVSIFLWNAETRHLVLRASKGLHTDEKNPIRLKIEEGLTGYVFSSRRPLSSSPASKDARYKHFPEIGELKFDHYYGVPIQIHTHCLGVLVVQTSVNRSIIPAEETIFQIISSRLAGLLEIADKLERLKSPLSGKKKVQAIQGKGISRGVAVGPVFIYQGLYEKFYYNQPEHVNAENEVQRLSNAFTKAEDDLSSLIKHLEADKKLTEGEINIFNAHLMILRDYYLKNNIIRKIQKQKILAETAVLEEIEQIAKNFEINKDAFLRERAQDFREIGHKILNCLIGPEQHPMTPIFQEGAILVAQNIGPSLLVSLYKNKIGGLITEKGGETSHTAILAQSLGIPAVSGIENICNLVNSNEQILVDGKTGFVFLNPDKSLIAEYQQSIPKQDYLKEFIKKEGLHKSAGDFDVKVTANIGFPADIDIARQYGIQEVGLFRTEFAFMQFERWPTLDEQVHMYEDLAKNFTGPVTIRTLDVGADKIPEYLSFPKEENPLLGLRSIRFSMENPLLFREQLQAVLIAQKNGNTFKILLPMISSLWEVETAHEILEQLMVELDMKPSMLPKLGIMMEVPGLFFQLKDYERLIDFIAVGTNDLIQYVLSVDRNSNTVRHLYSGFHPSVLRMLSEILTLARSMRKEVSVCGEMAGSVSGALALIALGYRHLSVQSYKIPLIHYLCKHLKAEKLREIRTFLLKENNETEIKCYLSDLIQSLDPKLAEIE